MTSAILNILPISIAAMIAPVPIIIVLLLLPSAGGLTKASAYVAGSITVRLLQGGLFGYVFISAADAYGETGSHLMTSVLLLIVGIVMLIAAYKKWRKEDDPDAPPPKWMAALDNTSAAKAFGLGALLLVVSAKQWVFVLSAISAIAEASLSPAQDAGAFLVYVVIATLLPLLAILLCVIAPRQSVKMLAAVQTWLNDHDRQIMIGASLIFGLFFLYKGIMNLLG